MLINASLISYVETSNRRTEEMNMEVVACKTLSISRLRFRQHIHRAPTDRLIHIAHKTGMHLF